ncbi:MAG: Dabb family protein [Pseudomonadota bacterium]
MITHVVMMKFKASVTDGEIAELEEMLDQLPEKITEIQTYDFGRDIVRSPRSYDFSLVSVFASLETLDYYQKHPAHLRVVKKLGGMCEHIAVVDYENKPYPHISSAEGISEDPWQSKDLFKPI